MTETTEIRRHPNGSIDLDHYARIGRALHGAAMRSAVRSATRRGASAPARLVARIAAAFGRRKPHSAADDVMLAAAAE